MKYLIYLFLVCLSFSVKAQLKLAKLKYSGGGDWYANKTALPNLISFTNEQLKTNIEAKEDIVEASSPSIYLYPYIYMTGHGNVSFSPQEADNLRKYLISGGFLHIDDNYGLDPFVRVEMKKVFPELEFVELPYTHPVYHQKFKFDNGLPKVHKHDDKPPQGFGLLFKGRLVCFYSYESDLGNGWEDQDTYNDPQETRLQALKMGANLLTYVFSE